jgi:hypothetical protein
MTIKKTGRNCKKGGNGAAEYGSYVWGTGSQQHAISADTNVISVANDPAKYTGDNKITGGDLTTIGVPAVLIVANQLYKRKGKTNKKRQIKGGAQPDLNSMMKQSSELLDQMKPTTIPPVVYSSNNSPQVVPGNVQVFGGGEVKQTGAGILTDIAVPALLITANQLYRRKSRKNKKYGKHRRTRRVSFKKPYK